VCTRAISLGVKQPEHEANLYAPVILEVHDAVCLCDMVLKHKHNLFTILFFSKFINTNCNNYNHSTLYIYFFNCSKIILLEQLMFQLLLWPSSGW